MVEVFKTNVEDPAHAILLVDQIHKNFTGYKANFDLQDCDNILRVEYKSGEVQSSRVVELLKDFGFEVEVLPDVLPVFIGMFTKQYYKMNELSG